MPLYQSAWLSRLHSSVSGLQRARGTDAYQLGLGPKALCCIVAKANVSPKDCTRYPHVLPRIHMGSAVLGDEALAISLDRRSLPLLRGVFGVAHYALRRDTCLLDHKRLALALKRGHGLIPRDPRLASIATPGLPEPALNHNKGLTRRVRPMPLTVRMM